MALGVHECARFGARLLVRGRAGHQRIVDHRHDRGACPPIWRNLYGPLTALTNARVEFATSLVSFERVFEVLDMPLDIVEAPTTGRHSRHRGQRRARGRVVLLRRCERPRVGAALRLGQHDRRATTAHLRPETRSVGAAGPVVARRTGRAGRTRRAQRRRKDHHDVPRAAALRRRSGTSVDRRPRCQGVFAGVACQRDRRRHPGVVPLP